MSVSDISTSSNGVEALRKQIRDKVNELSAGLKQLSKRRFWVRLGPKDDPARIKFLASIVQKLSELKLILDEVEEAKTLARHSRTLWRIKEFVHTQICADLYVDDAWRVADALKIEMVPLLAGHRLVAALRQEANEADTDKKPPLPSADELQGPKLKDRRAAWRIRQEIHCLLAESAAEGGSQPVDEAWGRMLLERLYLCEAHAALHDRTVTRLQGHYLTKLSILLLLLLGALMLSLHLETSNLTAAFAGAAGGTLARALRIRELLRITGLRGTWFTAFAQSAIGAMLGLLTYWAFVSGLVTIAGWSPKNYGFALLAVAGGFIEPFSLGILERVTQTSIKSSENNESSPYHKKPVARKN